VDLCGHHKLSQPAGDEAPQILRAGFLAQLQDYLRVWNLAADRVGHPDHA
jgi:hypothetical protein